MYSKIHLASAVQLACLVPNIFVFFILFKNIYKTIYLIWMNFVCVLSDLPTVITSLVLSFQEDKAVGRFFCVFLTALIILLYLAIFQLQLSLSFK